MKRIKRRWTRKKSEGTGRNRRGRRWIRSRRMIKRGSEEGKEE